MGNIFEKKYAPFMEQALHHMMQMSVTGICIITRLSDGSVFTQYHNSNMMDKMTYAGVIQQDVTLDMLKANNMVGEDPPESVE